MKKIILLFLFVVGLFGANLATIDASMSYEEQVKNEYLSQGVKEWFPEARVFYPKDTIVYNQGKLYMLKKDTVSNQVSSLSNVSIDLDEIAPINNTARAIGFVAMVGALYKVWSTCSKIARASGLPGCGTVIALGYQSVKSMYNRIF